MAYSLEKRLSRGSTIDLKGKMMLRLEPISENWIVVLVFELCIVVELDLETCAGFFATEKKCRKLHESRRLVRCEKNCACLRMLFTHCLEYTRSR